HGPIVVEPHPEPFERLVTSIVNQQLSGESAAAIHGRLTDRFEITPEALLAADQDALRETGLSGSKVDYVKSVAEAFQDGRIDPDRLAAMDDDEVVDALTEVRGVGVWTAKMFMMFVLGREDVFPVEDLGIRRGMERLFGDDIERAWMVERAAEWAPYRTYASRYLWRAVD
ncbi:MAG: DNA-3-methyladenine glycosylase 2 family protein, partial [Actinobacteria bacterium]|nr:DNA-3-methyladenine glycosylase 2 family protein [Actinomycetota bacterium]NIW27948.1 DNA-3-methyladenine glycosylase 2 family protein [Actinomycetota bacterium]NIX20446.1 DNA-3-methyladenine glycosylase 2 family protein [Actinomycetota bacterium]